MKALSDPELMARVAISGEMTFDTISLPITGVLELRPGASHTVITLASGASAQTSESTYVGGHKYERVNGVWFDAGTPDSKGLGSTILGQGGFRDTGIETKNGQQLHHLELPTGSAIPPEALGFDDPAMGNAAATLEAWAEEDGTPAVMLITASWSQASGEVTMAATMTMELAFKLMSVEVATPANVWARQESAIFGYKAAYPADWEFQAGSADAADWFSGFDGSWIGVWREKTDGSSLSTITTWVSRHLDEFAGLKSSKLDSNTAAKLAGVTARRLDYHGTADGEAVWETTIIAVSGSWAYFVDFGTLHEPTKADLERLSTFLAQFSMT